MTFRDRVEKVLSQLPHRLSVEFALYCCNDIKDFITDPASIKALELTQKWLDTNGEGVTAEELLAASNAAVNAAYASYATAAYASYATGATGATAAYASYAAVNAAYAAGARKDKEKQYLNHLVKTIANLSELERVLWDVEVGS